MTSAEMERGGQAFADAAVAAASDVGPDGRFGERKVFISEAWEKMGRPGNLESFKRGLVVANREGRLQLARFDLPGAVAGTPKAAMSVRSSTRTPNGAEFNFIVIG